MRTCVNTVCVYAKWSFKKKNERKIKSRIVRDVFFKKEKKKRGWSARLAQGARGEAGGCVVVLLFSRYATIQGADFRGATSREHDAPVSPMPISLNES